MNNFQFQWVVGFVGFLFPGFGKDLRKRYKPKHVFWGVAIFFLSLASIFSGLMDKARLV